MTVYTELHLIHDIIKNYEFDIQNDLMNFMRLLIEPIQTHSKKFLF